MNPNNYIKETNKKDPHFLPFLAFFFIPTVLFLAFVSGNAVVSRGNYAQARDVSRSLILEHQQDLNLRDFRNKDYLIADAFQRGWTEKQLISIAKEQDPNKLKMYQEAINDAWPQKDVEMLFR